jgi:hypothetical protein
MTEFLLLVLSVTCFASLAHSLITKDGVYQYAFLATGVFAGFVLVQLVGLSNNEFIPRDGLNKTIIMTILCLIMVLTGSKLGGKPYRVFEWDFSQKRLHLASAVLSLFGAFFFFLISRLPVEQTSASQWSGLVVAYHFFAQSLKYGLAIALIGYLTTHSKFALVILVFDLTFYIDRIFIAARRGDAADLIVIFALALWFKKRIVAPRPIVVGALILGTLFIYSTGDYRGGTGERPLFEVIANIDFQENLKAVWLEGGPELENAVYQIESADLRSEFDFGSTHWNGLVFNYVPAQLFGSDFKDFLTIKASDLAYDEFGYTASTGSTRTGMTDSFLSFWYFGALEFFIISYVLARIYSAAVRGNITMQLLFILMLVKGLHSITHHTNWFVSPWVHLFIFLTPAILYARTKRG